jgi:hypothetical protein
MNEAEQQSLQDIKVDENNLYREENFTDLRVASIRRLVPIKVDGSPDESRSALYVGSTHIMSQMGPIPVQAQMDVKTLAEAIQQFPQAIAQAIEEMVEEAKERRRDAANRIVVPGTMPPGGLTGSGGMPGQGGMPGGAPPGGKIQLG